MHINVGEALPSVVPACSSLSAPRSLARGKHRLQSDSFSSCLSLWLHYTIVFHLLALVLYIQVLTLRVLFCMLFSRCAHAVHSYSSFISHCCVVIQHVTMQPSIHAGKGTWAVSNGCYLGLLCGGLLLAATFILISFSWCTRDCLCGTGSR